MKKILSLLLVLILVFAISACAQKNNADETGTVGSPDQTVTTQGENTDSTGESEEDNKPVDTDEPSDSNEPSDSGESSGSDEPSDSGESSGSDEPSGSGESSGSDEPADTDKSDDTDKPPAHTHSYSAATCTQPKKCSCGATSGKALGHKWSNATCKAPKTCSVCKVTEGSVAAHKWSDATCKAPKTCSVCKKTEGNAVKHAFNSDGKCKWCKQVLPVTPSNLKSREYSLCELGEIEWGDPSKVPAVFIYGVDFDRMVYICNGAFIDSDFVSEDYYADRSQEWLDSCRVTYKGKDYYSMAGGYDCELSKEISGNYIVVTTAENYVISFELLSNDTLRVVSVSGTEEISVGDIFA